MKESAFLLSCSLFTPLLKVVRLEVNLLCVALRHYECFQVWVLADLSSAPGSGCKRAIVTLSVFLVAMNTGHTLHCGLLFIFRRQRHVSTNSTEYYKQGHREEWYL